MSRVIKLLLISGAGLFGTALFAAGWLAGARGGVAAAQPQTVLSHFQCYELDVPPPPFQVQLRDQFSLSVQEVDRGSLFCAPVMKVVSRGTPQPFTGNHLRCYRTEPRILSFFPHEPVMLRNQFGVEREVTITSTPRLLCVPTEKRVESCTPMDLAALDIRSGIAGMGGQDAVTEFQDAAGAWQPAFIVNNVAWTVIGGTSYVSLNMNGAGPAGTTVYRGNFALPMRCVTTCLTVELDVYADNRASAIRLNGTLIGAQAGNNNFGPGNPTRIVRTGVFPAINLGFDVVNASDGPTALDYRATVRLPTRFERLSNCPVLPGPGPGIPVPLPSNVPLPSGFPFPDDGPPDDEGG